MGGSSAPSRKSKVPRRGLGQICRMRQQPSNLPYFVRADWREFAEITIGNHGSVKLSYDLWQFRRILVNLALSVTFTIHFLCLYIYDSATAGEVKGLGTDVVRGADEGPCGSGGDSPEPSRRIYYPNRSIQNIILFRSHRLFSLSALPVQSKRKRLSS